MADEVPGDRGRAFCLVDVAAFPTDGEGEFNLPIELCRAAWLTNGVIRTTNCTRSFEENDRLSRKGRTRFHGMVDVVEADANKLSRPSDACPETGRAFDFSEEVGSRRRVRQGGTE